jgi:hypothetical protein
VCADTHSYCKHAVHKRRTYMCHIQQSARMQVLYCPILTIITILIAALSSSQAHTARHCSHKGSRSGSSSIGISSVLFGLCASSSQRLAGPSHALLTSSPTAAAVAVVAAVCVLAFCALLPYATRAAGATSRLGMSLKSRASSSSLVSGSISIFSCSIAET